MKIKKRIKEFIEQKGVSMSEIAKRYGTSQQNISKYLGGKTNIPLNFIVWLANEFPDFDLEIMMLDKPREKSSIVAEESAKYRTTKEQILEEIGEILDKYI